MDPSFATYLYGPRRSGKSTICMQLLEIAATASDETSCLYLNLEDPVFAGNLDVKLLEWAVREHAKAHGKEPKFVFLDEAQLVPMWEKFVRMAVDRKRFKAVVTGSSSKLLSSEFASSLGGRGIGFLVLPFSYREALLARPGMSLDEYCQRGGYPQAVLEDDDGKRRKILLEFFDSAISKDIVTRYKIREGEKLRSLAVYALTNSGNRFSFQKLRRATGLSFDSIRSYLDHLSEAYLIFKAGQFSFSLQQEMQKPRKYYAVDTGMQLAVSKALSTDGRRFENLVGIELLRRGYEPQYWKGKNEVDFVVRDGLSSKALNVTLDAKPPAREIAGLEEFKAAFRKTCKSAEQLAGKEKIAQWLLSESAFGT